MVQDPGRVIARDISHSGAEKRCYCFGRIGRGILTVRFTYVYMGTGLRPLTVKLSGCPPQANKRREHVLCLCARGAIHLSDHGRSGDG